MAYDDTLVRKVVGTIHVESAEEIKITFKDGITRTETIK